MYWLNFLYIVSGPVNEAILFRFPNPTILGISEESNDGNHCLTRSVSKVKYSDTQGTYCRACNLLFRARQVFPLFQAEDAIYILAANLTVDIGRRQSSKLWTKNKHSTLVLFTLL